MALLPALPAVAANPAHGNCRNVQVPVALNPGAPANQTVSATYCQPVKWAAGTHEVDVLTPGATYNRAYWDWPQNPSLYSYVDKTLQAGRATFDYDRIGTGGSSHPPSTEITVNGEAYVLHQIITWLHNHGYAQVNSEGHSYGSAIAVQEAGTYRDVSRIVVTGLTHVQGVGIGFPEAIASLYPAALDPEFAGKGLDLGYLTTEPGVRGRLFYSSSANPAVVAYDEAHKDLLPAAALATLGTTFALPPPLNASDRITAPVLLVDGQEDAIFCTLPAALDCANNTSLRDFEAPDYAAAASLSAAVVPSTGHDLALHPSANTSFSDINTWINSH
jgi:pimeloyl-ACP methyl ester carboxylesterase